MQNYANYKIKHVFTAEFYESGEIRVEKGGVINKTTLWIPSIVLDSNAFRKTYFFPSLGTKVYSWDYL